MIVRKLAVNILALNTACRVHLNPIKSLPVVISRKGTTGTSMVSNSMSANDSSLGKNYFLLKSEPEEFSIQDLSSAKGSMEEWSGVRNFAARNILREMKVGDEAFFYHSSCKVPGIVGTVRIVREVQPDETALDPKHSGYDPKSKKENCRWDSVKVRLEAIYPEIVTLKELKAQASVNPLIADMTILKRGRLSVTRVKPEEWEAVVCMLERKMASENISNTGSS